MSHNVYATITYKGSRILQAYRSENYGKMTVIVAQLAEQSFPTPEDMSSAIGNFDKEDLFTVKHTEETKIKKKG